MVDTYYFPFEEIVIFQQFGGFFFGQMNFEITAHIEHLVPQIRRVRKDPFGKGCRTSEQIPLEIGAHHRAGNHLIRRAECNIVRFDSIRCPVDLYLETSFDTKKQHAPALLIIDLDEIPRIFEDDEMFRQKPERFFVIGFELHIIPVIY